MGAESYYIPLVDENLGITEAFACRNTQNAGQTLQLRLYARVDRLAMGFFGPYRRRVYISSTQVYFRKRSLIIIIISVVKLNTILKLSLIPFSVTISKLSNDV